MRHTPRTLLLTLALAGLAGAASAQTTLYEQDFSQGIGDWTVTTGWNWLSPSSPCLQQAPPVPGQNGAARFGSADCTFLTTPFYGTLTLEGSVEIPEFSNQPTLSFLSYADSELCNGWDNHDVLVSTDDGQTWEYLGDACFGLQQWVTVDLDLSAYRGEQVRVRFAFNAVDDWFNDGLGWIVDDVRITTEPCLAWNHCVAAANSTGVGATMGYFGTKRIHRNDFVLTLDGGPPGEFAHFFYGPEPDQVPAADGFLCVGAGNTGLVRLLPSGSIDGSGHLQRAFDFPATLGSAAAVLPGTTWHFQCWYRDPSGGGTGSNFSDALQVTFCP